MSFSKYERRGQKIRQVSSHLKRRNTITASEETASSFSKPISFISCASKLAFSYKKRVNKADEFAV